MSSCYTHAVADGIYSKHSWRLTWLAITAMVQAKSTKAAEVIPAIRDIHYSGITGKISFDQRGDLKNPTSTLYQVKKGAWVPVTVIGVE